VSEVVTGWQTDRATIFPKDESHWLELRAQDLTSTSISALFGISPYCTEFELFHRFRDKTSSFKENERTIWGNRLQDAIATGIAEDQGWECWRMKEYMRIPHLRLGSSFDFGVRAGIPLQRETGILEVKNVDGLQFRDRWLVDGDDIEAPPHIELQVQHQMLISGAPFAYIGALIGGNSVALLKREADEKIHRAIFQKSSEFFDRIDTNRPPSPDWVRDADFICQLYAQGTKGKVIDLKDDGDVALLAQEHRLWHEAESKAKSQKDAIKAQLLTRLGDATKALGEGFSISAPSVGPTEVPAHTKAVYRNFRIYWKKESADGAAAE
jgi:putative phage-type endonuclease